MKTRELNVYNTVVIRQGEIKKQGSVKSRRLDERFNVRFTHLWRTNERVRPTNKQHEKTNNQRTELWCILRE